MGGSLFGSSSVPTELQPVAQQHAALSKAETTARPLVNKANTDYADQTNPDAAVPSAPVQAGRLSSLMKSLASAESAVNDSIKAREELIGGLEKVLEVHRRKLAEEATTASGLSMRRTSIEAKRKEVEDVIFRRVNAEDVSSLIPSSANGAAGEVSTAQNGNGGGSPEMEGFTPPPPDVETFTPTGSPKPEPDGYGEDTLEASTYAADPIQEQAPSHDEPPPAFEPPPALKNDLPNHQNQFGNPAAPGFDLLNSLTLPHVRPAADSPTNGSPLDPRKRRKMSHKPIDFDEQLFASGEGVGLDEDVAAHLGAQ